MLVLEEVWLRIYWEDKRWKLKFYFIFGEVNIGKSGLDFWVREIFYFEFYN